MKKLYIFITIFFLLTIPISSQETFDAGVKQGISSYEVFEQDYPKIMRAIEIIDALIISGDIRLIELKTTLESIANEINSSMILFQETKLLDGQMLEIAGDKETMVNWRETGSDNEEFNALALQWEENEKSLLNFVKEIIVDIDIAIEEIDNYNAISYQVFGSCKSLVYKGEVSEKINFVLIPPKEEDNEQELMDLLFTFFDESQEYSFYSVYPYSEHKEDFNIFYLSEYDYLSDSTTSREIKQILKEKCPILSENIYQILSVTPLMNLFGTGSYFKSISKVKGNGFVLNRDKPYTDILHANLHEIGHSFGGLGEGYGKGFFYPGIYSYPSSYYKENYHDNSNLPANWDIEGCPKWCSGQINTNSLCYEDYVAYKECVLSPETITPQEAQACTNTFNNDLTNKGIEIFPHDCNFGVECAQDTNCWLVGMPFFRAYDEDIMYSTPSIGYNDIFSRGYGPTGGEHIKQTIELLKQWNQQKNNLEYVNFEIIDSYINNFDDRDKVYIEFKLLDSKGNVLSIFKDDILDDIFSVKYKKSGESDYINLSGINKYLNGNYYLTFTNYRSEKDLPVNQLDFIFEIKLPKFENSWNYTLTSN